LELSLFLLPFPKRELERVFLTLSIAGRKYFKILKLFI
jgi:hypothetical protein